MQQINSVSDFIKSSDTTVIVFSATGCHNCNTVKNILDNIQRNNEIIGVPLGYIDIDKYPDLIDQYSITSMPTTIIFKHGEISSKEIGIRTPAKFIELIN